MQKKEKIIFIFFGPPGSGKGTQADMLAKKFKIPRISTGDLLRDEIKRKTKIGKEVEKILAKGRLVADNVTEKILFKRIKGKDAGEGFILDGFPRNIKQQNNLMRAIGKKGKGLAVLVDVSDKEVKARLGGRRMCVCGATYHLKYNPPKKKNICDLCAGKLFIREDDKPAVISDRLKLYYKEIAPVLKYWERAEKLVEINGEQSIKAVQEDILKELKL